MRLARSLSLWGSAVGVALLVMPAEAFQVKIPNRSSARAVVPVDEAGVPIFTPANPAQVEVLNLPPPSSSPIQVEVTNFPGVVPANRTLQMFGTSTCPSGSELLWSGSIVGDSGQGFTVFGSECLQSVPSRTQHPCFAAIASCAVCRWSVPTQTFTTYGASTCPSGTTLLYAGVTAIEAQTLQLVSLFDKACFATLPTNQAFPSCGGTALSFSSLGTCAVCRF